MHLRTLKRVLPVGLLVACNVFKTSSQLESVQSIHHSGKILLWWSPDGDAFYVKQCDDPVADQKIDSLEILNQVCVGPGAPGHTTRQALRSMMTEIASSDSGFASILRDEEKAKFLEEIEEAIAEGKTKSEDINTALTALSGQLENLKQTLKQMLAELKSMQDVTATAAQADGQEATAQDLEFIFGEAYRRVAKAIEDNRESQRATEEDIARRTVAYQNVKETIVEARKRLAGTIDDLLDRIADKESVHVVSLLQRKNYDFSLLQSAAIRLNLIASHVPRKVTCTQVCQVASPFYNRNRCYSCRCKDALGGSLPSPAELNCKVAEEVKIYRLKSEEDGAFALIEQKEDKDTCFNPSLLYGDCRIGSRIGQLRKGDVYFKWICRHRSHPTDVNATYGDVGIAGTNTKTGATCWWDDYGGDITDEKIPKLDLTDARQEDLEFFDRVFGDTRGEDCIQCHDSDPFLKTPYLSSVKWQTGPYTESKYASVGLDGQLIKVPHGYLVSDEAFECTACHRIASSNTCDSWARQSMGMLKPKGFEKLVTDAVDTQEGGVRQQGANWRLAYWMPPTRTFYRGSFEEWHDDFGEAKDHVLKCCTDPAAAGCKWVDAYGEPMDPPAALDSSPAPPTPSTAPPGAFRVYPDASDG